MIRASCTNVYNTFYQDFLNQRDASIYYDLQEMTLNIRIVRLWHGTNDSYMKAVDTIFITLVKQQYFGVRII